ncbi:carboxypeptidase-like regulatory domain-containing protein [Singulisphaera sp. GP187]|uniref:carboxypeptidase-like regulatory domain-containing protein n=1 Tax=Singulisphaera sp. GP187 TaxID=1882752 RepID=UPI0020B13E63|nr:carboxypeptidase-like regulatory domain-containing protein [Singulisphaera sp. GP187]
MPTKASDRAFSIAALMLLSLMGCGVSGPTEDGRFPIRGTVVQEGGQPLGQGSIVFHPESQSGIQGAGTVIKDGRYELRAAQGLTPGRYAVEIQTGTTAPSPADDGGTVTIDEITGAEISNQPVKISRSNPLIPQKNSPKRMPRIIEVTKEGPNQFDFDLSQ